MGEVAKVVGGQGKGGACGQVKVAVIESAVIVDRDLVTTHEPLEGRAVEGGAQSCLVLFFETSAFKPGGKVAQGHVGDGVQVVEGYLIATAQQVDILGFELFLI